ncbi:MAG: ABC transporter permease, partial [Alphaproteobacteria bacterium]
MQTLAELFFRRREIALSGLIVILLAVVGARAPVFLSLSSLEDVLTDSSILVILAIGQMMVILTRAIDISVASNLAFCGMFVALLSQSQPELPVIVFMLTAGAIGLCLGAVNGFFVAVVGIPPIVTTLGTLSVYRGLIFVLSGGAWVSSNEMSQPFQRFPMETTLGLTNLFWSAVVVTLVAWVFLNHTRIGRTLYAVGGNPIAAHYVGISVRRARFLVYCISGTIAGIAGYLWVARFA